MGMLLKIENVGIIEKAEIDLSGLSVIAGNNDTGKSTVGKLIFSVIKAFQRYKEEFNFTKNERIEELIDEIYRDIRRNSFLFREKMIDGDSREIIREDFFPPKFFKEILTISVTDKENLFDKKKNILKKIEFRNDNLKKSISKKIDELKELVFTKETKEEEIKKTLKFLFSSEFKGQISNFSNEKSKIEIKESNKNLIVLELKKNEIKKIKITDDILDIKDITYVETPILLNYWNKFREQNLDFKKNNSEIQFHNIDLVKKIGNSKFGDKRKNGFYKKVKDIIGGSFSIKKLNYVIEKLIFTKDKNEIEIESVATGIKSFGILDLLDQAYILNKENLLILDEPEVHIHPSWQVEYAKLIIYLIKERGLNVLITSHSPYMIEALNKFSEEEEINKKCNFYLAEKNKKGGIEINDKTNKQDKIFKKLSEPFEKLIWN